MKGMEGYLLREVPWITKKPASRLVGAGRHEGDAGVGFNWCVQKTVRRKSLQSQWRERGRGHDRRGQ